MSNIPPAREDPPANVRDKRRVAIVNSIVDRSDAISASVRDMAISMASSGYDVRVFCYHSDFDDIQVLQIHGNSDLMLDDFFSSADLIVWHFGIYFDAFNTVMFGNGHAPRVICFHNVTPEEFVPEASRSLIQRSIAQTHLLPFADEIWAVSDVNASFAIKTGVSPHRIFTMPLQVDSPPLSPLAAKRKDKIELLYVGRFAKSKGVLELLEAYRRALVAGAPLTRLTLAGNVGFSDQDYYRQVNAFIRDHDLKSYVEVAETINDEELFRLYRRAHLLGIASYHEGFCKPVVEALRSGCIPVGYNAYNIPFVANGFGALVPVGDVAALSDRLVTFAHAVSAALAEPTSRLLPLDRGATSAAAFDKKVPAYVKRYEGWALNRQREERMRALIGST